MGLLSSFFSNKKNNLKYTIQIVAPISGEIIPIENVPDEIFSKKIVGDGIAIKPSGKSIVSPVDGIIHKIFNTLHAFSIKSDDNVELFVHFGIDTVQLKGRGFKRKITQQMRVKKGDSIIDYDLNFLKKNAKSILTPIVISNIEKFKSLKKMSGKVVAGKTIIMLIEK
ncbi:PTS system glucose-specific transporter [Buchnera aphidicola (Nipponaphis monzeni)]|uniref:PTS system glucose-specific EIIA component n=1 Tax=Buchnera aphidicola (Nipponaphis monzeni) TaxID=2495405 RepID=A0A455T9Q0_9GAMM|nr:PTS glucose transporter subunit IIA [Buchnera aphidicola]BBI01068.1 PTS system glucose-specific transporter [Buchnera aphidicola (Nipponaphis monzeni)]